VCVIDGHKDRLSVLYCNVELKGKIALHIIKMTYLLCGFASTLRSICLRYRTFGLMHVVCDWHAGAVHSDRLSVNVKLKIGLLLN